MPSMTQLSVPGTASNADASSSSPVFSFLQLGRRATPRAASVALRGVKQLSAVTSGADDADLIRDTLSAMAAESEDFQQQLDSQSSAVSRLASKLHTQNRAEAVEMLSELQEMLRTAASKWKCGEASDNDNAREAKENLEASKERVSLTSKELEAADDIRQSLQVMVADARDRRSQFISLAQGLQTVYQQSITELQQSVLPKLAKLHEKVPTALLDQVQRDSSSLSATIARWTSRVKEAEARDDNAMKELERVREAKEGELDARKESTVGLEENAKQRLANEDPNEAKECSETQKRVALLAVVNKGLSVLNQGYSAAN